MVTSNRQVRNITNNEYGRIQGKNLRKTRDYTVFLLLEGKRQDN